MSVEADANTDVSAGAAMDRPINGPVAVSTRTLDEWLQHIESVHFRSIDMGLDRVAAVIDRMGLHRPARSVITVGGTNGKGSCVAMIEAIARTGGLRTGAYTSPHLVHYGERIRVDGVPSSESTLCAALDAVDAARGNIPLTYFEFGTVVALEIFRRADLDLAILEVGMGGRLDAVNAIESDAAVVVSIGIDHVDWLGPDRAHIATEKAGIFRNARPAICGDPDPPSTLIDSASAIGAQLWLAGRDFGIDGSCGAAWDYRGPTGKRSGLPAPGIPGQHQRMNAACALAAMEAVPALSSLDHGAYVRGLAEVQLPGRLQVVGRDPLRMIDVAHNAQALAALANHLEVLQIPGKTRVVLGMLRDKPVEDAGRLLGPWVDEWYVAGLPGERGGDAELSVSRLREIGIIQRVFPFDDVFAAWQMACRNSAPDDCVIAVGSFVTAGGIIGQLDAAPAA